MAGVWLFYVQHQFEDVYWEAGERWSYADAALEGSSYLKLPKVLQFFTGNIGLHHVHHLNARVPNYNLQAAHDENEVFADVPVLTMRDSHPLPAAEADRRRERSPAHLGRGARARSQHLDRSASRRRSDHLLLAARSGRRAVHSGSPSSVHS